MKPLRNTVLAEIIEPNNVTKSGLILPVNEKNKYRAKVLYVGFGVKYLRVGDIVNYHQGRGTEYINEDGKNCIFLNEEVDIDHIL
jgi:co-chaperonin GroES (HSP10)